MLPPLRVSLSLRDIWSSVLASDTGAEERLERGFAERFGFPFALLFPYARSAFHALITSLGLRERPILCPAYTCAVVPLVVALSGNRPVLVDSAPNHFLPGRAQWLEKVTPDTAMIVPTPLHGYAVDKGVEVLARARAPGLFVLYDEAQSCGAEDQGGVQCRDADGALISLGLGKMITSLSGGVLLLRSESVFRVVRDLRASSYTPAAVTHTLRLAAKSIAAKAALYEPMFSFLLSAGRVMPALSFDRFAEQELAMTDLPPDARELPSALQARIGLRQLARMNELIAERRKIGAYYERRLREEGFRTFAYEALPTWTRYPLAVADRPAVLAALEKGNISAGSFLRYSCAEAASYKGEPDLFPHAGLWGRTMVNLPNWPGLRTTQAERAVEILLRHREQNPSACAWPGGNAKIQTLSA